MEERSARERRFSTKLKPSPVRKNRVVSSCLSRLRADWAFKCAGCAYSGACEADEAAAAGTRADTGIGNGDGNVDDDEDKPRPLAVGEKRDLSTEGLPLGFPMFPLLVLTSRRARAPKLRRLANGVLGTLEADGAGSSSKGLSSTEPELALETLSARERTALKGDVWFGEPDRPMVVRERRRR